MLDGHCEACGFAGDAWSDADALVALAAMPERWAGVVAGVDRDDVGRRLVEDRWSIAEYVDHVRETMFAMRFLVDLAVDAPGTDLGAPGEPVLDPTPRSLDAGAVLRMFSDEVGQLCGRLHQLPAPAWTATVVLWSRPHDVRWVLRNSLHETSHHLGDITLLAAIAGGEPPPSP